MRGVFALWVFPNMRNSTEGETLTMSNDIYRCPTPDHHDWEYALGHGAAALPTGRRWCVHCGLREVPQWVPEERVGGIEAPPLPLPLADG